MPAQTAPSLVIASDMTRLSAVSSAMWALPLPVSTANKAPLGPVPAYRVLPSGASASDQTVSASGSSASLDTLPLLLSTFQICPDGMVPA